MVLKRCVTVLIAALLVFAVTACGSGKSNDGKAEQSASTDPSSSSAASATESGDSSSAPANKTVVINANAADNVAGSGEVADLIQDLEKKIKEDANSVDEAGKQRLAIAKAANKVMADLGYELKQEDWGWSEPLVQKQTAALVAKQTPDIITGETQSPGFAAQGLLEPFPDWLDQFVRENVVEGAWKPMEYQGKIYGVAFQPGVSVLFWNKDLFRKSGLDPDKGPATWSEWLEMSKKINEAGKGKFYGSIVYSGPNNGGYLRAGIYPLMNGGGFVNENNEPIFNDEKNMAAFQFLRDLNQYAPKGAMANGSEAAYWDPVNKNQVGIWAEGPWMISMCATNKLECGMGPLPLPDGGKAANITIGAAFASVPVYAKNKEGGFKFIEAMLSDGVQQMIADTGVRAPVTKKIAEGKFKTEHPELYQFYEALQGNVRGLPTFSKENTKVWQVYGDAMVRTLMTNEDIKKIWDDAQTKVEAMVK
ncbi:extracellular solute-binding protein [Cohnella nanjingensis]|uniref:Extracellular solute-binding protein n=1 Tax=Cohnella nanjingensis TaxID=1387779 RepID=A0A7X0RVW8_9BACL|nr:extracellular solute-binding protein [Cohnella nanjingensis]MBB6674571.1 extracellular solute-binding protein [Cohnella nanjingensis]